MLRMNSWQRDGRRSGRRCCCGRQQDTEARAAIDNRPVAWSSLKGKTANRLHPAEVFRALRPYVERDPDTVLICDGGEFAQWGQSMLPVRRRMINGVAGSIDQVPPRPWIVSGLSAVALNASSSRTRTFVAGSFAPSAMAPGVRIYDK